MTEIMTRKLGRSGIEVSAMGMGCWAIGGQFWRGDQPVGYAGAEDSESIKAIQRAVELGVTFFDTADVYGTGHSEKILGEALEEYRDDVVIATKFGNVFDSEEKQITGSDASPDYIRKACEASLERLNTDYIDLYQLHLNMMSKDKAEPARKALEELVEEGMIRYYGWSTDDPERAKIFEKGAHCTAIQHDLNVLKTNKPMIELCEKSDLASINRTPLGMGLLTGKYGEDSKLPEDDVRGTPPEWMEYFKEGKPNPEWLDKLEKIRNILTSEGRTLAQGALAWIWAESDVTIPIPGFKTVEQVEENIEAMEYGPLDDDQMRKIDEIVGERSIY